MGFTVTCFFALMLFVFSIYFFRLSVAQHFTGAVCHKDDHFALLQFNQSLTIDKSCSYNSYNYPKVVSWKLEGENSTGCCSWEGVKCDKDTGHVIRLDLGSSCLYGSINSTSTLFHLVHLEWLSLRENNFNFSEIPSGIKNLSKLSYLDLCQSYFAGQIPSEMLELSRLEHLDLSNNVDIWKLPHYLLQLRQPDLRSLVDKLTNLQSLYLDWVNISSPIPNSLGNLSSLTDLSLRSCNLHGTIPASLGNLSKLIQLDITGGRFSSDLPIAFGNLGSLQSLYISFYNFSSQVQYSISNLTELRYLFLDSNDFGVVRSSSLSLLSKLSKLTNLSLQHLNLVGEIPLWIMNLTELSTLIMLENQLTGPLPYWLMNLNQLSSLILGSNQITGQIPSQIGNLTRLSILDLSSNRLQGPIPKSLVELKHLDTLNLYSNNLSGTVDLDMYLLKLQSLGILILSSNNIHVLTKNTVTRTVQKFFSVGLGSCNLDVIPLFLKNQDMLGGLDLSSNNIHGQIPRWLLSTSKIFGLETLNLSNNHLTGFEQHPVFFPWSKLYTLDLTSNKLQGSLPLPASSIEIYLASNNKLTGGIPPWICNLTRLKVLDLSYNNLGGVLPKCLGSFSNDLSLLSLPGNNFYGSIPDRFMSGSSIRMIDLSHNKLHGKIPRSLANCTSLEFLNLGYNQIIDIFPTWLGVIPDLRVLILKSNKFHGVIREPKTNSEFSKLLIIDLSQNMFTGDVPSKNFEFWGAMKVVNGSQLTYMEYDLRPSASVIYAYFDFPSYAYNFIMNNKGIELKYGKISNKLISISLSGNRLTGEIPPSISNLRAVKNLDLSNNNLQGHIPSSLGNLRELESLDLSNNNLSGKIPQRLVALLSLGFINVSYNNLKGPIPQGYQFDTFENRSFEGNPKLCGKPLSKMCENHEAAQRQKDRGSYSKLDWKFFILFGLPIGVIVGAIIGIYLYTRS